MTPEELDAIEARLGAADPADLRHLLAHAPADLRRLVAEVRRLRDLVDALEEGRDMACEQPDPRCECPGCSLARERNGAILQPD